MFILLKESLYVIFRFAVSLRWQLIQLEEPESPSIPYQRYGHTAVTYDENAFIWGGRNDKDGACNVLYGFSSSKYLIV